MFSNLRQGSQLHILHKSANPYVELGTIETVSNLPMYGYYPNLPAFPMDISVRVGEKVTTYQQLPSNAESAETTERTTGEQVFIACSKEVLNTELQSMRQKSCDTINSVPYHEQRIKSIDTLISQLNPEQAEKAQREKEMIEMRAQMQQMAETITQLTNQLKGEGASSSKEKKGNEK